MKGSSRYMSSTKAFAEEATTSLSRVGDLSTYRASVEGEERLWCFLLLY